MKRTAFQNRIGVLMSTLCIVGSAVLAQEIKPPAKQNSKNSAPLVKETGGSPTIGVDRERNIFLIDFGSLRPPRNAVRLVGTLLEIPALESSRTKKSSVAMSRHATEIAPVYIELRSEQDFVGNDGRSLTLPVSFYRPTVWAGSAVNIFREYAELLQARLIEVQQIDQEHNEDALARLDVKKKEVEMEMNELQAEIREVRNRVGGALLLVDSEEQLFAFHRARFAERASLEQDLAGLKARRAKLDEQLARVADRSAKTLDQDAAVRAMFNVHEHRQKALERMRRLYQAATISQAELATTERELAEAEANLAREKQLAARRAGGDQLAALNLDVNQTDAKIAEAEARLAFVAKAVTGKDLKTQFEAFNAIQRGQAQLNESRMRLQEIQRAVVQLKAASPFVKPSVAVLGR